MFNITINVVEGSNQMTGVSWRELAGCCRQNPGRVLAAARGGR